MSQQVQSRAWRRWLAAMGMVCASGFYAVAAYAHATMVKSDPARRAVVSAAPNQVRLWFSERLEAAYSSATVARLKGAPVAHEPASVAPDDPKLLVVKLPSLEPGTYEVRYRVLSVDGHVVKSSFTFTLKPKSPAK